MSPATFLRFRDLLKDVKDDQRRNVVVAKLLVERKVNDRRGIFRD